MPTIYIHDICNENIISDISNFSLMKISARQLTRRQTNCTTTNWAIGVGQLGDNAPNIFTRFVHVFTLVNLY